MQRSSAILIRSAWTIFALVASSLSIQAQDRLTVGGLSGGPGSSVQVPIHVRDVSGTILGMDQPPGSRIQGLAVKVVYTPAAAVATVAMDRAGIIAGLDPISETKPKSSNSVSYFGLFDEATDLIPFTLGAPAPGDRVLTLTVGIAATAAPGTVITLAVDTAATALSNQGGTAGELASDGGLAVVGGSVTVVAEPATGTQAFAQSATSINVSWLRPVASASGFRVERTTDGVAWPVVATVGPGVSSCPDSGLSPATWYGYRVVALYSGVDAPPSNLGVASTFPAQAAKVCVTQVSPYHSAVGSVSASADGTGWAVAWTDRRGGESSEIYFQRLNAADGSPAAPPVRVTTTDAGSSTPLLRWNGTHFGLLWIEGVVGAPGNNGGNVRFALLAADGTKLHGDVRVAGGDPALPLFNSLRDEASFTWDGSGWGVFFNQYVNNSSDAYYLRLSESGSTVAGPVRLSDNSDFEDYPVAAWNGSEYGMAWWWQRDDRSAIYFQRMSAAGVLVGSPLEVAENGSSFLSSPSVTWDGSRWAVAWEDPMTGDEEAVFMRRIDASGSPLGPATRVSTDLDPDSTPGNEMRVWDEQPRIVPKPGGGYLVYCSSFLESNGIYEVTRLEADPSGNRIGTRTILSDKDNFNSNGQHVAQLGDTFLLGYNEGHQGTPELALAVVDANGTLLAARRDLTSGHSPGTASFPSVVPVGAGFAALWREPSAQIYARIYDGSCTLVGTRFPLSSRSIRRTPTTVPFPDGFAVAWKDNANSVLLARYDATGAVALPEVTVATGAGGRPDVGLAFSGEDFGLAWAEGGNTRIAFQLVGSDGSLQGPKTSIATQVDNTAVRLQWVGTGWAVVWVTGNRLRYALLDGSGAVIVPPRDLTPGGTINSFSIAWSGQSLGVGWTEYRGFDPPGSQVYFASLNLDGSPAVTARVAAQSLWDQGPVIQWDRDRFRLVYAHGGSSYELREVEVLPDGSVVGPGRFLSNRTGNAIGAAWNGVTWGLAFTQVGEMYLETSECLADLTPPPCPDVSASFDGTKVHLAWAPVEDAETGIWRQILYRNGLMLAELLPTTLSYDDSGFVDGAVNTYELRALNGAWMESVGCPGEAVSNLHGDVNGDGAVNVLDVFYLINFLFAGGPGPIGEADVNADGQVNVQDVFYFINYLFAGGAPPV